jgi:protein-tyrosine-phosphatase
MKRQATHWTGWVQPAVALSIGLGIAIAVAFAVGLESDRAKLRRTIDELQARVAESILLVEEDQANRITRVYAREQAEQLARALERIRDDLGHNGDPHAADSRTIAARLTALLDSARFEPSSRAALAEAQAALTDIRRQLAH